MQYTTVNGLRTPVVVMAKPMVDLIGLTDEQLAKHPTAYFNLNPCWGAFFSGNYTKEVFAGDYTLVVPHRHAWCDRVGKVEYTPPTPLRKFRYDSDNQIKETSLYNKDTVTAWFEFARDVYGVPKEHWDWVYYEATGEWCHFIGGVGDLLTRVITSSIRLVWEYPLMISWWAYCASLVPKELTRQQKYRLFTCASMFLTDPKWDELIIESGAHYNRRCSYMNSSHWITDNAKVPTSADATFHSEVLSRTKGRSSTTPVFGGISKVNRLIGGYATGDERVLTEMVDPTKEALAAYIMECKYNE